LIETLLIAGLLEWTPPRDKPEFRWANPQPELREDFIVPKQQAPKQPAKKLNRPRSEDKLLLA